jgi:hypothetical protein
MKAEFLKDVHKDIWFFYAQNIQIRNCNKPKMMSSDDAEK